MDKIKFLDIINSTPLVSIDLIIEDHNERYLLGQRANKPAQGFWFVPGGRIRKNETLQLAFERIVTTELGASCIESLNFDDAKLLGAYDHIYSDNFANEADVNTHYVALGYKLSVTEAIHFDKDNQHSELSWWSKSELMASELVHQNTKNYF